MRQQEGKLGRISCPLPHLSRCNAEVEDSEFAALEVCDPSASIIVYVRDPFRLS